MVATAALLLALLGSRSEEEEAMVRMLTLQQRSLVSDRPLPTRWCRILAVAAAAAVPSRGGAWRCAPV